MILKTEEYAGEKIFFKKNQDYIEAKVNIDGLWYIQTGMTKNESFNKIKKVILSVQKNKPNAKLVEFKRDMKNGRCPFCKSKLEYYDGALGYEAMVCKKCKFSADHTGFHLED